MDLDLDKLKKRKKQVTNVRIYDEIYLELKKIADKKAIPTTRLINHLLAESLKELLKKGE